MTALGIRARIALLAVLPVSFASLLLTTILVRDRLDDKQAELAYTGSLLARQIASNAEFGLFSGNREQLEAIAGVALSERAVSRVVIRDGRGQAVVTLGYRPVDAEMRALDTISEGEVWSDDQVRISRLVRRSASEIFNELFAVSRGDTAPPVGAVELTLSLDGLHRDARSFMWWSGGLAFAVIGVTALLALRFGEGMTRPLRRLGAVIERIGAGDFSARAGNGGGPDMERLADGVNRMAERLGQSRSELEQRIAEATAELSQKKRDAEMANEAKSRFLAAASHDLRQPMHALGLFADQLSRQPLSGEAEAIAGRILEASESLGGLLDALLDISRLDAGVLMPNRRDFPLAPLFARLQGEFAEAARSKGLYLRVRTSALWVESDPVMCERVLINLIANAIRYTETGGILVAARRRGGQVRVEVRDSGIGIPEHSQELVFSEFVQLANPERDQRKGLGLGLSIVARICGLLDHRRGLRSQPGCGSCFWFELPLAEPRASTPSDRGEGATTLAGRVVGIVEEDPAILAGMRDQLGNWGCNSVTATSIGELVSRLVRDRLVLDLLVCDCRSGRAGLDELTGIEARLGYRVPVVVVSADGSLATLARAMGIPLLTKPVRPARLRAALDSMLKRSV